MSKSFKIQDIFDVATAPAHVKNAAKRDMRRAIQHSKAERRFNAYMRAFDGKSSDSNN